MNILYIHTHDSGKILSPYGYAVPTPNLQEFTKDALLFRNAYTVSPTCSPSRAALLTGTYPHTNGMLGLAHRGFQIKNYDWHLVRYLKKYGYHTVLCGIQHEAGSYLDHNKGARIIGYDEDISTDNSGINQEDLVYWDFENAKKAAQWIKENGKRKKFFLSFGTFATHRPYPKEIDPLVDVRYVVPPYPTPDTPNNREDHARYLTSVAWFDRSFGLIIRALKEAKLYEDTIIIFTTDHGVALPYSKCTLFDTGIGISLIIRVPGAKSNGEVCDALVSNIDVYPTLCDLLNLPKPEQLQGYSFVHLFDKYNSEHRKEVFAEINFHTSYEPVRCIRTERYKYIRYMDPEYHGINFSNIDNSPAKTFLLEHGLKNQTKPEEALYDLYFDPGERHNLANDLSYASVLEYMRTRLLNWQLETSDPLLKGPIKIQPNWKVNKKTCIEPSSKDVNDYCNIPNN